MNFLLNLINKLRSFFRPKLEYSYPKKGHFSVLSHIVTKDDYQLLGRMPKHNREFIDNHLDYSIKLLMESSYLKGKNEKEFKLEMYSEPWHRVYEPCIIDINSWDEMWLGTFQEEGLFKLSYKDKSVVVKMLDEKNHNKKVHGLSGLLSSEVHYFLGTDFQSEIEIEKVDDNIKCGLIK